MHVHVYTYMYVCMCSVVRRLSTEAICVSLLGARPALREITK